MTLFRFGPLLAAGGAACLVAWTPEGRAPPPPDIAAVDLGSGSRFDARPVESSSGGVGLAQSARDARPTIGYGSAFSAGAGPAPASAPPVEAALSDANLAAEFAYADISEPAQGRVAGLKPPSAAGEEPDGVPPPQSEAPRSDADVKVRFAYADLEGAAPALGALSEIAPPSSTAALEPSAPAAAPEPSASAPILALPPPPPISRGRDPVQEGRRCGACGARRYG